MSISPGEVSGILQIAGMMRAVTDFRRAISGVYDAFPSGEVDVRGMWTVADRLEMKIMEAINRTGRANDSQEP